jgi:hypothetical protein
MQLRVDEEKEVLHGVLYIVLVDPARRFMSEAPVHHLPEHSRTRPVELHSQILKLGTSHRIQASIHADAGT